MLKTIELKLFSTLQMSHLRIRKSANGFRLTRPPNAGFLWWIFTGEFFRNRSNAFNHWTSTLLFWTSFPVRNLNCQFQIANLWLVQRLAAWSAASAATPSTSRSLIGTCFSWTIYTFFSFVRSYWVYWTMNAFHCKHKSILLFASMFKGIF